jgi:hypothetical protein
MRQYVLVLISPPTTLRPPHQAPGWLGGIPVPVLVPEGEAVVTCLSGL